MQNTVNEEQDYYDLVQRAFRILAPFYDFITFPIARLRTHAVNMAGAKQGATILDVATGTGAQATAFARKGFKVTAIDLSDAMLQIAQRKARYSNLKFEMGDATNLRFETASFDVVCISFALHDMPAGIREKVLKEMARVARPGGMILAMDYALPKNRIGQTLIHRLVRLYEAEYYTTFVHSDLKALLAQCGFEVVLEKPLLFGAARLWKGVKHDMITDSTV